MRKASEMMTKMIDGLSLITVVGSLIVAAALFLRDEDSSVTSVPSLEERRAFAEKLGDAHWEGPRSAPVDSNYGCG